MKLFLMRHGEAARAAIDEDRELTPDGKRNSFKVAHHLSDHGIEMLISSPYRRAKQTAEEVESAIKFSGEKQFSDKFTPDADPNVGFNELCKIIDEEKLESLMLVCHLPIISHLASLALDGELSHQYSVATSTIICLQSDQAGIGCFDLIEMISPQSLKYDQI